MHLSHLAIERPRLVILFTLFFCAVGVLAAVTFPKERTPRVKVPVIMVAVPNLGAQPPINEREIIRRVEKESGSIEGLKNEGGIQAQAVHGAAVMQFVFDDSVSIPEAKRDVEEVIDQVKGQFPIEAQTNPGPIINDVAFEDLPIIQVFVAGGQDGRQRRRIADRLKEQIQTLSGVAGVDIFGGLEEEIHLEANPHLMTLYGFRYDDLAMAVRRANQEIPSGAIEKESGSETRVRTFGKPRSLEDIQAIVVGVREGKPIKVGDLAQVTLTHKPRNSIARYGGQDAAVLLVRSKTDVDVWATANGVQAIVDRFQAGGGAEGATLGTVRSQAREIRYMLWQLGTSALYGAAVVMVILMVFMGLRNALLIAVAIPFAVLGTAAMLWFAKKSVLPDLALNNMVLFGLILVVGMVVDGAIIAGENIYRHRELGTAPLLSAKRGIDEVSRSLTGAYLTTFAAFAPMYIVRGIMGDFMSVLPTVVLFALCSAMLVDHFLLPTLSVYWMKVPADKLKKAQARQRRQNEEHLTIEQMEIADAEALVAVSRIKQVYGSMVRYALHHRLAVLTLSAAVVATPVAAFLSGAISFEFFPESDIPVVEVHFELPLGSSMEHRTVEVAHRIEAAVLEAVRPEEWYRPIPDGPPVRPVTTIGQPTALNINMDYRGGTGPEYGLVYIELAFAEDRERSSAEIRRAIVQALPPLPGVIVKVSSPSEGPPAGSPVLVRVLGREDTGLETLGAWGERVRQVLQGVPGTYDVVSDYGVRPEIEVQPNTTVAALYDLDIAEINSTVNYALEGVRLGEVDFGGDENIDLRLRSLRSESDERGDLADLPLRSRTGRIVSLDQVAELRPAYNPNLIRHYDQQRVVHVRSELDEGMLVDDVKARLVAALRPELSAAAQRELVQSEDVIYADQEVTLRFGGENEIRDDAMADLEIAMVIAGAVMMIVLVLQFNSFVQPLIILFSVPLSLVGVAIGLMLCGFHFSVSAMIGVVALAGIVVNDAIVLVDFINRLRASGIAMERAVVLAGQLRLRPIFLTTITTVGGLLPMALNLAGGGEFWQPLTVTMMAGLSFATLLQLFIVPLACYTFCHSDRPGLLDPTRHPRYAGDPDPDLRQASGPALTPNLS